MMSTTEVNLHMLTGGLRPKVRVQHPQVKARKDREGAPWIFRYRLDEIGPDGQLRTVRKYHALGPSKGAGAISKKQAEVARDQFLTTINSATSEAAEQRIASAGGVLFSVVAEMYKIGYLGRQNQIAKPTRDKELLYLNKYIIPKWGALRLSQIQPKAVEDWLHTTFDAWWTMHGVRAVMGRVFTHAEGHGLWEEGKRNPASRAKLGRKRHKRERRILSFEQTARVLERIEEPYRLIVETCIATGARISEVLGLCWKHVNFEEASVKIEQRVWQQDLGRPKTEESRRTLGIGSLTERYRAKAAQDGAGPNAYVFSQKGCPERPMWDSGVRNALHRAAAAEGCDFEGFGPHSFRRANITWRQQVGGSAIEASKIAGHTDLEMTSQYTIVPPERQNELTLLIQQRIADAKPRVKVDMPSPSPSSAQNGNGTAEQSESNTPSSWAWDF